MKDIKDKETKGIPTDLNSFNNGEIHIKNFIKDEYSVVKIRGITRGISGDTFCLDVIPLWAVTNTGKIDKLTQKWEIYPKHKPMSFLLSESDPRTLKDGRIKLKFKYGKRKFIILHIIPAKRSDHSMENEIRKCLPELK